MTNQLQLTTSSLTIFHLTDINTHILNPSGSRFVTHERDPLPDFLLELQKNDFAYLIAAAKQFPVECCLYTNELELSYIARQFQLQDHDFKIIVLGPFLKQVPSVSRLDPKFKIDAQKQIQLEAFYRSLKLISTSRVQSAANLLEQIAALRQASLQIVNRENHAAESSRQTNIESILQQSDDSYIELIELRYQIEKEMSRAVEKGDKAQLEQVTKQVKNVFDFSERFPNQPVRALKNALIVLNTLLRVAAERGHVQPIYRHRISEKFSKLIERSDTIDSLNKLTNVMYEEYCDLVRNHAVSGYSPVVQKAVEHIRSHFNRPLNISRIADTCGVHPSHLSRQFKKETGMTLTDYQQKQRIEEAKIWLKSERASISWIAEYIGYEDSGYFTRVFKKLVGMSPSQYRTAKK